MTDIASIADISPAFIPMVMAGPEDREHKSAGNRWGSSEVHSAKVFDDYMRKTTSCFAFFYISTFIRRQFNKGLLSLDSQYGRKI